MKILILLSCILFLCSCDEPSNQEDSSEFDDGSQGVYALDSVESNDYLSNPPIESFRTTKAIGASDSYALRFNSFDNSFVKIGIASNVTRFEILIPFDSISIRSNIYIEHMEDDVSYFIFGGNTKEPGTFDVILRNGSLRLLYYRESNISDISIGSGLEVGMWYTMFTSIDYRGRGKAYINGTRTNSIAGRFEFKDINFDLHIGGIQDDLEFSSFSGIVDNFSFSPSYTYCVYDECD